ncbi:Permease of the drug/metabolite transporter (DMT) superfamily [Cetobacterium ceti]|uniref:Permease of the drug/metabolite transporter (DMT) superfamily n=1 Tax=Cetobacterium ceti TaxID=180163 RepID=A0A1T4MTJ7_9FUSO|nr:DMT family transporter [Cetobacterium ceti]SJZ70176.1 Permease of the drug/metabolite transporter (DMT) superfamily [Cetobacterium ceti]
MNKETLSKFGLFSVAAIWGSGFVATKIALNSGITPYAMVGIRFLGAFLILYSLLKIKNIKITKEEMKLGAFAGIFLFFAFAFQTVGLLHTTSSKNAFITGANVIFVPFIFWLITQKKPSLLIYISSFLCFIGIGILSIENNFSINYGDFLTFICAIFFAIHIVVLGAKINNLNPLSINCFQMLSAGLLGILGNIIFEDFTLKSLNFNFEQSSALIYLILFNTLLCYIIQTISQKYVPPSKVSLILTTEMVFGSLFSILILNDPLTSKIILGGLLIFSSIILAESNILEKTLSKIKG